MKRISLIVGLVLSCLACGGDDGGSLVPKVEAFCQRCNPYATMEGCMHYYGAQLTCTNCPEELAELLACHAQFDCEPSPDDCVPPPDCRQYPLGSSECSGQPGSE